MNNMMNLIDRQGAIDHFKSITVATSIGNKYNEGFVDGLDFAVGHLKTMPSVQSIPQWIPCSERLPEEDDYRYCIECLDGAVWYFTENGTMGLGYYYKSVKEWSTTDDLKTDGKVVAWMPLPEPYKENEYEKKQ